jgi:hypothetical protein
MRLLLISLALAAPIFIAPVFAQPECCQCGPSACGPAPSQGDCTGCELIPNAVCDGETGQCVLALQGSFTPGSKAAPALGGGPVVLLAAGLTALGFSLLARRRKG